jgi:hypothetical protein
MVGRVARNLDSLRRVVPWPDCSQSHLYRMLEGLVLSVLHKVSVSGRRLIVKKGFDGNELNIYVAFLLLTTIAISELSSYH